MPKNLLDRLFGWAKSLFSKGMTEAPYIPSQPEIKQSTQSEEWLTPHKAPGTASTWQMMRTRDKASIAATVGSAALPEGTSTGSTNTTPFKTSPTPLKGTEVSRTSPAAPSTEEESSTIDSPVPAERVKSLDPVHQEKILALNRLRDLPRGVNIDGRSAAIVSMLEDNSFLFAAVRAFRWPELVTCPRCHSTRVKRRPVPSDSVMTEQWYYTCLNCQSTGSPFDFDDATNINLESIHSFRQWMACYYLLAFCSPSQLTKILGLGADMISRLMFISDDVQLKQKHEQNLKKKNDEEELLKKKKRFGKKH